MGQLSKQQFFFAGLFVFFIINIFQATFLELHFDEAYYWLYSRNLAWGYFDHPPVVAALIFAGTKLFGGYLGVRFFFVLLSTVAFILLWDMVKPYRNSPLIYWLMVFSIGLWIPYTFYAVPDGPLFFFSVLFLWLYKKYLQKNSWWIVFALAVASAALMYSKYHGALLLFFVFLSNWKLIKERKAWALVFIALILLIPHFYWQFENNFPTLRYHLVDSHQTHYKIGVTLNYLFGELLLAGPFLGWLFLYSAIRYRASGDWERALKFVFAGVFLFFFAVTFGGDIELHWTLIAYIPMFVLAYAFIVRNGRWFKLAKKIGIVGFFVFLSLRIYLVLGASTCPLDAVRKMAGWKDEIALLREEAGNRPVVFSESYQKASLYAFHANRPDNTYAMLSGFYKYSQFDLYNIEEKLQGKDVLFVSMDSSLIKDNMRHVKGKIKDWYLLDIPCFNSFCMLEMTVDTSALSLEGKVLRVPEIKFSNPYQRIVEFEKNHLLQAHLQLFVRRDKKWAQVSETDLENIKIPPGGAISLKDIRFNLPDSICGGHHFFLGLQNGPFLPIHSHAEFDMDVE